jgi:hypothetical protein
MNRSYACSGIQLTQRYQMVGVREPRVLRERDKVSWYSRGLTPVSQPKDIGAWPIGEIGHGAITLIAPSSSQSLQ